MTIGINALTGNLEARVVSCGDSHSEKHPPVVQPATSSGSDTGTLFAIRGYSSPYRPTRHLELKERGIQIQVRTDNHIPGRAELVSQVENVVEDSLARFSDRITRVEVHLSDQNSRSKSGANDKRCVMEARLAGLQPITVTAEDASLDQAVDGAARKLQKTLHRTLESLDDPKGSTSFAGDPPT